MDWLPSDSAGAERWHAEFGTTLRLRRFLLIWIMIKFAGDVPVFQHCDIHSYKENISSLVFKLRFGLKLVNFVPVLEFNLLDLVEPSNVHVDVRVSYPALLLQIDLHLYFGED